MVMQLKLVAVVVIKRTSQSMNDIEIKRQR